MKLSTAGAMIVVGCGATSSWGMDPTGPLEWITDIRRCSASYTGNGSASTWQERPDMYGPFQGAADLVATNGVETWSPHCTQESSLDTSSVEFAGWSEAAILASILSLPQSAQGQSKLDMWFTIDVPVHYELSGTVSESGHADSMAMVRLTNLDGDVIEIATSTTDTSTGFTWSGTLEPGMYRLYAESLGKCRTLSPIVVGQGTATCEMSFSVSEVPEEPEEPEGPVERPRMTSSTPPPPRG